MRTKLKLLALVAGLGLGSGAAHAQDALPPAAPPGPGLTAENSSVRNGGDTAEREAMAARDAAIRSSRGKSDKKSMRSVPAKPEEVVAGSEVRDPKGELIGTIDSVTMAAAVVNSPGGKVEVPLEAFGKNSKGLLVGMAKADFDAAVAAANKPAS